jgi:hypothetical protein
VTGGRRRLVLLEGSFAICRLPPDAAGPVLGRGALVSATRTSEELSIVCPSAQSPPGARVEDGWRALKLRGPIPFEETGVLSALATALARRGLSLFALSTFDTDYVLVREAGLRRAVAALRQAGYSVGAARPVTAPRARPARRSNGPRRRGGT